MDENGGSIGVNSQENTAMPNVLGQESVVYECIIRSRADM